MVCKHTIQMLEGRADGVHCKGCGQVFKTVPEQEKPAAEPKKEQLKKTTTKGGKNNAGK